MHASIPFASRLAGRWQPCPSHGGRARRRPALDCRHEIGTRHACGLPDLCRTGDSGWRRHRRQWLERNGARAAPSGHHLRSCITYLDWWHGRGRRGAECIRSGTRGGASRRPPRPAPLCSGPSARGIARPAAVESLLARGVRPPRRIRTTRRRQPAARLVISRGG